MNKKLVFGVGINDADYVISPTINSKPLPCKIYATWKDMLRRCYDPKYLETKSTYVGCLVDKEWHSFMQFRAWMLEQDFEGKQLDKDLLFPGNNLYSKDRCVFIPKALNVFILDKIENRTGLPRGAYRSKNKFIGICSDPFTKSNKYLGTFETPEEAHLAWKKYKHKLALEYSKLETDPRVIKALVTRFL